MQFDTEQFIKEVEVRTIIWDSSTKKYTNKALRKRLWDEIAFAVFNEEKFTDEERHSIRKKLQKKWKNLRTSFSREIRRRAGEPGPAAERKSTYMYFNRLKFLLKCYEDYTEKALPEDRKVKRKWKFLTSKKNVDTKRFIKEVEVRTTIWDPTTEDYNDQECRQRLWNEIACALFNKKFTNKERYITGKWLKKKWQNLRACFFRELKRRAGQTQARKRSYVYFDHLKFLLKCSKIKTEKTDNTENAVPEDGKAKSNGIPTEENHAKVKKTKQEEKETQLPDTRQMTQFSNNTRKIITVRYLILQKPPDIMQEVEITDDTVCQQPSDMLQGIDLTDEIHTRIIINDPDCQKTPKIKEEEFTDATYAKELIDGPYCRQPTDIMQRLELIDHSYAIKTMI